MIVVYHTMTIGWS